MAVPKASGGTQAIALLITAGVAAGAWGPLLGWRVLWMGPVVVVAAGTLAARWFPLRLTAVTLAAWLPAALPAGGVPLRLLWPSKWDELVPALSDGVTELARLGSSGGIGDTWARAVWLFCAGALYLLAAGLTAGRRFSRPLSWMAFALLIAPWGVAVAVRQTDEGVWQGPALLLAALLWFASREAARAVLVLGTAVATAATATAYAVGPRTQWFDLDNMVGREPQFRTLDTAQTYGPLRGRRTGATMLDITAPKPALWRMQVLERFGWRGWETGGGVIRPNLPEPAAETVDIQVRVRGLRDGMVVSPGHVESVDAKGKVDQIAGDARRVTPAPRADDAYSVRATMVNVDPAALRAAPAPTDDDLLPYTTLWRGLNGERLAGRPGEFGVAPDVSPGIQRLLDRTSMDQVVALSQRLAGGARTEYEVVERVQRFLTKDGGFRYSTNVALPERMPLVDFLLNSRVGYCQHFAGAAALLLRLAGVPTRVVVGFATGKAEGDDHYKVRDTDAHAWIEVYFKGQGWVPFNPTPSGDAQVASEVDPFAPPTSSHGGGTGMLVPITGLGLVLAAGIAVVLGRRSRNDREGSDDLLERLVRRTGGQVTQATTLTELRTQLARIGPHIAAVAAETERSRYAPDPAPAGSRLRIARALIADLGVPGALRLLATPAFGRKTPAFGRKTPAFGRKT